MASLHLGQLTTTTTTLLLLFVVSGQVWGDKTALDYIEDFKKCYNADKSKVDDCSLQLFRGVIPLSGPGIKELDVPNLDPANLGQVKFPEDSALIQGKAVFDNVVAEGLSKATINKTTVDKGKQTVKLDAYFPVVNASGKYDIDGNMLLVPVKSKGDIEFAFHDVDAEVLFHLEREGVDGLKGSKVVTDFTAKNITLFLHKFLGGEEVGTSINKLMNENSQDVVKEIKPQLNAKLSETLLSVYENIINKLPAEAFVAN